QDAGDVSQPRLLPEEEPRPGRGLCLLPGDGDQAEPRDRQAGAQTDAREGQLDRPRPALAATMELPDTPAREGGRMKTLHPPASVGGAVASCPACRGVAWQTGAVVAVADLAHAWATDRWVAGGGHGGKTAPPKPLALEWERRITEAVGASTV